MVVSKDRRRAYRTIVPFIEDGLKALEDTGLLSTDRGGIVGNMTNKILDGLEESYGVAKYYDGHKSIEIARHYRALWKFTEKTEWESKLGECDIIKGVKCNVLILPTGEVE